MSNGHTRTHPLTSILAFLACLVLSVQSAKESTPSHDSNVLASIQKREADTHFGNAGVDYSNFHAEPVKRSTNEDGDLQTGDVLLDGSPDKRGRGGNRYGFYGALGKRANIEDIEKRRLRKMFFGSLGKRRRAFFASLGKRDGGDDEDKESLMEELVKRGRGNRYFFGSLGKRNLPEDEAEDVEDVNKRRMPFFGSLGKRNPMIEEQKRGRNKFGFYGALGKRDDGTTLGEGTDTMFESLQHPDSIDIEENKRGRNKFGFYGALGKRGCTCTGDKSENLEDQGINELDKRRFFVSLGKRVDGLDFEKRRRFAFASLGKRFDDGGEDFGDDDNEMEKRRMKMRPSFYGALGKRIRNKMFFGQLGKRSVSATDDEKYDDQSEEEETRTRRSALPFGVSRRGRNKFGFYGALGKRDCTCTDDNSDYLKDGGIDELDKRRFFGSLGKREDDMDFEKRRRFAFASLGKRFDDDVAEHSRTRRSASPFGMPRRLRGAYGRPRRFNRRLLGQRVIRRTRDFRFFPQLGKRSYGSVNGPEIYGEY